jgi:hypothetical protein
MLTPPINQHYVLECRRGLRVHYIPIPRPSPLGIDASPPETANAVKKLLVACPECGLVSAYSGSDVQVQMSPRQDPFEADVCRLVSLNIECDDKKCDTPTTVHTIIDNDKGTWTQKVVPKVVPKDWEFASECLCYHGHPLAPNWEENHIAWERRRLLF